jgi:hypothetical protein
VHEVTHSLLPGYEPSHPAVGPWLAYKRDHLLLLHCRLGAPTRAAVVRWQHPASEERKKQCQPSKIMSWKLFDGKTARQYCCFQAFLSLLLIMVNGYTVLKPKRLLTVE